MSHQVSNVRNTDFFTYLGPRAQTCFDFSTVDEETVIRVINSLNSGAAVGLDKISVRFIQKCKVFIAPKVTEIMNNMIMSSQFEDCLKTAKVVPLHKSGDKLLKTNYRPISILPALSKIPESVINDQMKSYLLREDFINCNQFVWVFT